jgi:hypothetical protein
MCGDNSMNEQSYVDLEEMMQIGSSDKVKVVVQIDNVASSIEPNCRRYLIKSGQKELLANLGEIDMANPQSLIDFAQFVNSHYNAQKYLLILWDHGNGWPIGYYSANSEKGVIYDQSSNNWIGVADGELRHAITEIKKILRKKVSILGFDACLMGMVEVASEITDGAEIMFASEEVTPWDGLPYNDLLTILTTQPNISASAFTKKMVELSADSYNNGSQGYEPCTFSAIDLKQYVKAQKEFTNVCNIISRYANLSEIRQSRNLVQTFAIEHYPPTSTDDYIDLIDFLERIQNGINNQNDQQKLQQSIEYFDDAVLEKRYVGSYLADAKGLAVWFPDNYIAFKRQLNDYSTLNWHKIVSWLSFLNNYYGIDDIKPTPVILLSYKPGNKNDFRLFWNKSIDLAPVRYDLLETKNINLIFSDYCDTILHWISEGFSTSAQHPYSQLKSFYSGTGNNLNNKITLQDSLSLPEGGLLSFQSLDSTEENYLLTGQFKRDIFYVEISTNGADYQALDSFYGSNKDWNEHRYLLPKSEQLWLRFRYKTDATISESGVFLDDIKVYTFTDLRTVVTNTRDTCFYVFNIPQGKYYYFVIPYDSFGNKGFVSYGHEVSVKNYCEPFSLPSPFINDCKIYCDFPQQEKPDLYIYTLSGELVTKINNSAFRNDTVYWSGRNTKKKYVASGIYLILLKSNNFIKIGKIAKVK